MKIELALTVTQARKVLAALDGNDDTSIAALRGEIAGWLNEHDARKAPWRKVVGFERKFSHLPGTEILECGHRRSLQYGRGNAGWVEERATKRRCEACHNLTGTRGAYEAECVASMRG